MQGVYLGDTNGLDFLENIALYHCYDEFLIHKDENLFDCPVLDLGFVFCENDIQRAKLLVNEHQYTKTFIYCKRSFLEDFLHNKKKLADYQELCAYLGLKTILGKSNLVLTNTQTMVARMLGYARNSEQVLDANKILSNFKRPRLLKKLESWYLKSYARRGIYGFYISIKLSNSELKKRAEEITTEKYEKKFGAKK